MLIKHAQYLGICCRLDALFMQWDSARPDRIGAPLRIGCPPHIQDFDEMAEVLETSQMQLSHYGIIDLKNLDFEFDARWFASD